MKQTLVHIEGVLAHIMANGSAFLHSDSGQQVYIPSRVIEDLNVLPGDELKCFCYYNEPEHAHTAEYKAIRALVTKRLDPSMEPKPKSTPAPKNDGPFAALADIPLPKNIVRPLTRPTPAPEEPPRTARDEATVASNGSRVGEVAPKPTAPVAPAPEAPAPVAPPVAATAAAPAQEPPARITPALLEGDELYRMVDDILNTPRLFSTKDIYLECCRRDPRLWKDEGLSQRITHVGVAMAKTGQVATAKLFSSTDQTIASAVYYARNLDLMIMLMRGEAK